MQRTKDISNKAIKITSKDLVGCHCHSKIKKISKKLASRHARRLSRRVRTAHYRGLDA